MIFAFMMVPLLFAVGVAIDYSRLSSVNLKLQNAADAAALQAALAYSQDSDVEINVIGQSAFEENAFTNESITLSEKKTTLTNRKSVEYTVTGKLEPMFVQAFGYPKLNFKVTSEASIMSEKGLELVIAFDATNSMILGTAWEDALTVVENTLEDMKVYTNTGKLYVSLVPFSDRVNIGTHRAHWLSGTAPSGWEGCIEPREYVDGSLNWAVNDDTSASGPFEATIPGSSMPGAYWMTGCPSVSITGPTQDVEQVIDAAKLMTNSGSGRFDDGMAWAWRLLSPKWSNEWGVTDYPAADPEIRQKKVIYMTDGRTATYEFEMSQEADWGNNLGSKVGFEHMVAVCEKMKSENIEIYMLQTDANPHATPYIQACASSANHYYTVANSSEIPAAFSDILGKLEAELRIVR